MLTDLISHFPDLLVDGYRRTSPPTPQYNCIAWAAGENSHWWEPDSMGLFFWPDGLSRNWDKSTLIKLFEERGYLICNDSEFEVGFEKVAIYEKDGKTTHAARQLDDGLWTSKLGRSDDISHSLDGLVGEEYGEATIFLRRTSK